MPPKRARGASHSQGLWLPGEGRGVGLHTCRLLSAIGVQAPGWITAPCPQGAHNSMAGDSCKQIITAEPRLRKAVRELRHLVTVTLSNCVGVRMSPGCPSSSPLPCPAA